MGVVNCLSIGTRLSTLFDALHPTPILPFHRLPPADLIARGGAAPDAYPPIKAGAHVQRELEHINLKPEAEAAA